MAVIPKAKYIAAKESSPQGVAQRRTRKPASVYLGSHRPSSLLKMATVPVFNLAKRRTVFGADRSPSHSAPSGDRFLTMTKIVACFNGV
jgi:hypothetical protein